jgi:hypothetical protein
MEAADVAAKWALKWLKSQLTKAINTISNRNDVGLETCISIPLEYVPAFKKYITFMEYELIEDKAPSYVIIDKAKIETKVNFESPKPNIKIVPVTIQIPEDFYVLAMEKILTKSDQSYDHPPRASQLAVQIMTRWLSDLDYRLRHTMDEDASIEAVMPTNILCLVANHFKGRGYEISAFKICEWNSKKSVMEISLPSQLRLMALNNVANQLESLTECNPPRPETVQSTLDQFADEILNFVREFTDRPAICAVPGNNHKKIVIVWPPHINTSNSVTFIIENGKATLKWRDSIVHYNTSLSSHQLIALHEQLKAIL